MKLEGIKNFISKNKLLIYLFLISLIFFLIQHSLNLNWDFMAYVLNAQNLFSQNGAFEIYRAPLVSFILFLLLPLGKLMEYTFIVLVASLFFFSSIKLSDTLYLKYFYRFKIDKELFRLIFYFFLLSPFVLQYATLLGTELLGLSFFMLFLCFFLQNKYSGHFLGLAFLTRYNFLMFFIFLFFNKSWKKIFIDISIFLITLFPFYLFYFFKYGNGFASIVDSYNLNVVSRQNLFQAFDISGMLISINWLIPFFIIGLGYFIYLCKKEKTKSIKIPLVFILIFLMILLDWYQTPFKIFRYLFNITLPVAFFSSLGFILIWNKIKCKKICRKIVFLLILVLFSLFIIFLTINAYQNKTSEAFKTVSQEIENLDLDGCIVLSPHWVLINYYVETAFFLPYDIEKAISQNKIVAIFTSFKTIDDKYNQRNIDNYSRIISEEEYTIIIPENLTKENCPRWRGYGSPSISNQCEFISERFDFLKLKKLAYKTCRFLNPEI